MNKIRVQEAASYRLDTIYRYTRDRWGEQQAERYITGLFEAFEGIETRKTLSKRFQPSSASKAFSSGMNDISFTGASFRTVTSAS